MAKIRTLKEEMLTGGNSQEHVYPRTTTEAVYTVNNKVLQEVLDGIKEGEYLEDEVITERHLKDQNITTPKIKDGAVTTEKIGNESIITTKIRDKAVTNNKLSERAVTNDKMGDGSVNNRVLSEDAVNTDNIIDQSITRDKLKDGDVSEEKLRKDAVSTRVIKDSNVTESKIADSAITTSKIRESAVTTSKIKEGSITNSKIANGTITIEKFDDDLRNVIEATTGLPSDILERFQNMSEDIAELQDSTYPIVLSLNVTFLNNVHTVSYSVRNKEVPFIGDTTLVTKTLANNIVKTLSNIPMSDGVVQSPVESNREIFSLKVDAAGHTSKLVSTTRYICYAGGSNIDNVSKELINTLNMYSSTNVAFNPTVRTSANQYIWIVVPSYLRVRKVTSQGFNVTMQPAQDIETSLGTFKAYRTVNTLTAQVWDLVIS